MVHIITVKSANNGAITRLVYTSARHANHDRTQLERLFKEQEAKAEVTMSEAGVAPDRSGPETQRARMLLSILNPEQEELT